MVIGQGQHKQKTLSVTRNMVVGETGVGRGKFWLGQCPSVPNELPDGETNYVFGEQVLHALLTHVLRVKYGQK